MECTFFIPVFDTTNIDCTYDVVDNEAFDEMYAEKMQYNFGIMNKFYDAQINGRDYAIPFGWNPVNDGGRKCDVETIQEPCIASVLKPDGSDLTLDEFKQIVQNGKPSVLRFDLANSSLSYEAIEQLNAFYSDAAPIIKSTKIPDNLKLEMLPSLEFKVSVDNTTYTLSGAKILQKLANTWSLIFSVTKLIEN